MILLEGNWVVVVNGDEVGIILIKNLINFVVGKVLVVLIFMFVVYKSDEFLKGFVKVVGKDLVLFEIV